MKKEGYLEENQSELSQPDKIKEYDFRKVDIHRSIINKPKDHPASEIISLLLHQLEELDKEKGEAFTVKTLAQLSEWEELDKNPEIANKIKLECAAELDKYSPPFFSFGESDTDDKSLMFNLNKKTLQESIKNGETLKVKYDTDDAELKMPDYIPDKVKYLLGYNDGYPILFDRNGEFLWDMTWW